MKIHNFLDWIWWYCNIIILSYIWIQTKIGTKYSFRSIGSIYYIPTHIPILAYSRRRESTIGLGELIRTELLPDYTSIFRIYMNLKNTCISDGWWYKIYSTIYWYHLVLLTTNSLIIRWPTGSLRPSPQWILVRTKNIVKKKTSKNSSILAVIEFHGLLLLLGGSEEDGKT